ncbi:MAG TPA: hypothetical protein VKA31_05965, partial [Mariprofundaceae bacterium]|nr:hypothetical protein [Mariprofundaceae bacterium]
MKFTHKDIMQGVLNEERKAAPSLDDLDLAVSRCFESLAIITAQLICSDQAVRESSYEHIMALVRDVKGLDCGDKRMDIKEAIEKAGGKGQVARICNVTWQSVFRWEKAGKLPASEWTGETEY